MSDVIARLQAADPFAEEPYELADSARVLSRITGTRVPALSAWRRFQLRLGAAVTGATLVTLGLIVAIQGAGSSLPILNFASPRSGATSLSAAKYVQAAPTMSPLHGTVTSTSYHLTSSASLARSPSSALAYQLLRPERPATEDVLLARVFGLVGTSSRVAVGTWQVRGTRATLTYRDAPLSSWVFSQRSLARDNAPHSKVATNVRALANAYSATLEPNFGLGDPTTTRSTLPATNGHVRLEFATLSVTVPLLVHGTATTLSTSFLFSTRGLLLRASGPALRLSPPYAYPILSPSGAVRRVNDAQSAPLKRATSVVRRSSKGLTSSRHLLRATLTRVELSLGAFQVHDGSAWLLPVYRFAGTVGHTETRISLLALNPHFVLNAASATELVSHATSVSTP